jgi:hypothetical protein
VKKTPVNSSTNTPVPSPIQAKTVQPSRARTAPKAPPVFRPQAKATPLQAKMVPAHLQHLAKPATVVAARVAPPAFLSHQPATPLPAVSALVQRAAISASRGVAVPSAFRPHVRSAPQTIQRAKLSNSDAREIASALNSAHTGEAEKRNTQSIATYGKRQPMAFSQREYSAFDDAIEEAESTYGITIDERVIGDHKDDEGIHAEMLTVSCWLIGQTTKPKYIAASQGVCARCQAVLDALKIPCGPKGGQNTQNWVHPYRHAGLTPPEGPLTEIPQKVTRNKEYPWT